MVADMIANGQIVPSYVRRWWLREGVSVIAWVDHHPCVGESSPHHPTDHPRQVTVGLLQDAMRDSGKGVFLIDGFPRNEENRAAFEEQVGQRRGGGRRVDALTLAMDP